MTELIKLKALADETRLAMIKLLLTHDFCVGALAKQLGISNAAVSQHLQVLRQAGLVRGQKRGYWMHYSVAREVVADLADELKALVARGGDVVFKCQDSKPESNKCCQG
ncbi:MAG: winged helix-turn-helix transcriptional regulator [Firmicutes bacterium]|nr:winged helix-turn-helix transcriptional regulator [Bacillota bacterium]